MRKKAQEREMRMLPSSSSSSLTYQSCLLDATSNTGMVSSDARNGSSYMMSTVESTQSAMDGYPMEQIWKEIEAPTFVGIDEQKEKAYGTIPYSLPSTAMWDYKCPEVFWKMEDDEIRMLAQQFDYGN
jgi:transcription factor MYB, plant